MHDDVETTVPYRGGAWLPSDRMPDSRAQT